ncbi:coproporphyrinogen III oxidase, partial [Bacillus tropicus]|nr:coproporphyrinogen III oxidase [Bacillus tropicus]
SAVREIGTFLKETGVTVTTIYYGGVPPPRLTAAELAMLYEEMSSAFPFVNNVREVPVETGRPAQSTPANLEVVNKWNINRIRIN